MKFTYIEDPNMEVIVKAPSKTALVQQIESLCSQQEHGLVGYTDCLFKELNPLDIEYFVSYGDKIYGYIGKEEYLIKKRLYELHDMLSDHFIYINQSCLGNINKIHHFESTLAGALVVVFKSGYKDYVSRRQVRNVKERIGRKNA